MKKLLALTVFVLLLNVPKLIAQDPLDGLWQGYDPEWRHVSNQLIALAEATPADKCRIPIISSGGNVSTAYRMARYVEPQMR